MQSLRLSCWERFGRLTMPTRADEDWRRLTLSGFDLSNVPMNPPVIRAGSLVTSPIPADLARQGLFLGDLETAAQVLPEIVRTHAAPPVEWQGSGKFEELTRALWNCSAFLYVPKGMKVLLPLQSLFQVTSKIPSLLPRTLVVVDEGASLTYMDEYASTAGLGPKFSSALVELYIKEGADLTYVHLQRWGKETTHTEMQKAILGRHAKLVNLTVGLGAGASKSYVESLLAGTGSSSRMLGIVVGGEDQEFDYQTLQDHTAPQTMSDLLYKTALKDRARSLYSGLIRVGKSAQRTDAYQANRNLLLSGQAKADSIPKLEILADDVRCTHGATVGPVDEDQRFYLEARGMSESEAERLIVEGFFEPIFEQARLEASWHERLAGLVNEKLNSI